MTNVWKALCNKDMSRMLRLLGCDHEYLDGTASDFECFREWCAACSELFGNVTAECFAKKISDLIGEKMSVSDVANANAAMLWKQCNNMLNEDICFDNICVEKDNINNDYNTAFLSDEKIKNISAAISLNVLLENRAADFNELCKNVEKNSDNIYILTFFENEFCRPDRYHAEEEYKKYINGEKCNIDLIIDQLLLEIIYINKRKKIQLIIDVNSNIGHAKSLVEHLAFRELSTRIFLLVSRHLVPEDIVDVCDSGNNRAFVTPCISSRDTELINELSRIYPRGAINVIDDM